MKSLSTLQIAGISLIIGALAGLSGGWALYHPRSAPIETYAKAQRQADGSLVLERKPDPSAKSVPLLPAGSTPERIVSVTIHPRAKEHGKSTGNVPGNPMDGAPTKVGTDDTAIAAATDGTPCPDVRVDLTLAKLHDGTRRVVASSPDGDVVGGLDVPVEPLVVPKEPRWAVSYMHTWSSLSTASPRGNNGALVQYQRGPFIIGGGGTIGQGASVIITAGIRF